METKIEAIRIDMSDYERAGEGANGASYNHKTDPNIMLKLYFPGKVEQPLSEMLLSRKVYAAGIPTPEPGDYVTDGERYGIRFRRIVGKTSYARACGDHPELVPQYAEEFAMMCRQLHSTHVDTSQFENVKDRLCYLLEDNPFYTRAEKDKLIKFIQDAPDTDTAIHGDLQFGNAIFAGSDRYFIDLGDFCYGYPLFDVGMVYLTSVLDQSDFLVQAFHMDHKTARNFWNHFAPVYYGKDRPMKDIEEEIIPYAGLKTIIIERDTKCPMTEYRKALASILK